MTGPEIFSYKHFKLAAVAILVACVACGVTPHQAQTNDRAPSTSPAPAIPPLSANDVSLLFPAPTSAGDFAKLIAVGNLSTPNPQDPSKQDPVWPDAAFQQFLAIAGSPAAQVAGTQAQIGLPPEAQSKAAWFIAGIRIDVAHRAYPTIFARNSDNCRKSA